MKYYTSRFIPTWWEVIAWLRYPRQRWGWLIAGPLWPAMAAFWLWCQLRYGDDWYRL